MTTVRVARRTRYTSIARETINDDRLSFRARGILVWLLDKPDDWRCETEAIVNAGGEGRDAVRTALVELESLGYLRRSRFRGADGRFHTETVIFERPDVIEPAEQVEVAEAVGSPQRETSAGFPPLVSRRWSTAAGSPPTVSQALLQRTETEELRPNTETDTPPQLLDLPRARGPTEVEIDHLFELFWNAYPRRVAKGDARKALGQMIAAHGVTREQLSHGLGVALRNWSGREQRMIPYPATWLRAQGWLDQPEETTALGIIERARARRHDAG